MKILLIILDGFGDRPINELGNKTPLEAARTPNLDFLAKQGICGLLRPVYQGKFPHSKDAHLSLFGYDLKKYRMSRGVFEVIGMGMRMRKEDVALRGNFATIGRDFKIIDRRAGRIGNTEPLLRALQGITLQEIKFMFGRGVSHRVGVLMRGRHLSDEISDNDPFKTGVKTAKIKPLRKNSEAEFTAGVLNEFLLKARQILESHPLNKERKEKGLLQANYILLREAGKLKEIPTFEKMWKKRACCVAGGTLYKGIGRILGMHFIKVKGATAKADTNIEGKFKAAKRGLLRYDFCYCHIKATDDFSHDGDFSGKKNFIEKIDKYLPVLFDMKNTLLVVTGDHATPCKLKQHSGDALPVLVFGAGRDKVNHFSEKECAKGGLGKIKSINLLQKLAKLAKIRTAAKI